MHCMLEPRATPEKCIVCLRPDSVALCRLAGEHWYGAIHSKALHAVNQSAATCLATDSLRCCGLWQSMLYTIAILLKEIPSTMSREKQMSAREGAPCSTSDVTSSLVARSEEYKGHSLWLDRSSEHCERTSALAPSSCSGILGNFGDEVSARLRLQIPLSNSFGVLNILR